MKKIKDPFSYSARWDSAGIDCVCCKYCNKKNIKEDWPTDDLRCNYHSISLNIELHSKGFKKSGIEGEWFCKDFQDRGIEDKGAFPRAVEEFNSIKDELEEKILYEACEQEYLCMIPFDELKRLIMNKFSKELIEKYLNFIDMIDDNTLKETIMMYIEQLKRADSIAEPKSEMRYIAGILAHVPLSNSAYNYLKEIFEFIEEEKNNYYNDNSI